MSFLKSSAKQFLKHAVEHSNLTTSARCLSTLQTASGEREHCKVLILGGGAGGCALASKLSSRYGEGKVVILEPADKHYYQPMFTLIGGGMKQLSQSFKPMASVLPKKAKWYKESTVELDPEDNTVITSKERKIKYEILLIATGLQLNYNRVTGLEEALSIPNGNVGSIYSPKYVERVYNTLRNFQKGNAIFTLPATPVKCPGAPQKIVYIAEHYFRKMNKRRDANIVYNTSLPVLFGVKHYADALWPVVKKRNITVNLRRNLIEVKADKNIAVFENLDKPGEIFEEEYEMLHAVPPMSAPDAITQCKELVNETGFVNVDKSTMQHIHYKNVFAIGDSSGSPNSKTAASAAAQSPVVYRNMVATLEGKELNSTYDGYASCPLVTGYNSCILAEFDYNLEPLETFPFPQNKERYTMFILKKDFMPALYWNFMLTGMWNGPALLRNALSVFKFGKK